MSADPKEQEWRAWWVRFKAIAAGKSWSLQGEDPENYRQYFNDGYQPGAAVAEELSYNE